VQKIRPPKHSLTLGASGPHLIHEYVSRPHSPPQTLAGSNQLFCHSTLSGPTDRHTHRHRPTYGWNRRQVYTNSAYALLIVSDALKKGKNKNVKTFLTSMLVIDAVVSAVSPLVCDLELWPFDLRTATAVHCTPTKLIAQGNFLLEHGHTETHTNSQTPVISDHPTHASAWITRNILIPGA